MASDVHHARLYCPLCAGPRRATALHYHRTRAFVLQHRESRAAAPIRLHPLHPRHVREVVRVRRPHQHVVLHFTRSSQTRQSSNTRAPARRCSAQLLLFLRLPDPRSPRPCRIAPAHARTACVLGPRHVLFTPPGCRSRSSTRTRAPDPAPPPFLPLTGMAATARLDRAGALGSPRSGAAFLSSSVIAACPGPPASSALVLPPAVPSARAARRQAAAARSPAPRAPLPEPPGSVPSRPRAAR
jgi:hypothetical protein